MNHPLMQPTIARTVSDGDAVALSYAQEQLCFLQKLESGLTAYNLPRVFRLAGRLDADAMEHAFRALIARHAILRTSFFEQDGVPMQRVQATVPFALERIDLSGLSAEAQKGPLDEALRRTAGHVFDLGAAPALVARLVKLGEDRHVLAVCLHHIVSDAWSNPILARDLAEAYRLALRGGGPVQLPPLSVQYADYAVWQRASVQGGALERQLEHWNRHLGPEVPALDLPTDHARPSRKTFAGTALGFDVPPALAVAVQKFCRAEKCTPFVALLAAWQVLLARCSGQNDFAIGVPNAGRHHEEVSELLGFFVTTQVFRVRLSPRQSLREICRQVRADALAALDNAELPFEVLLASRKDRRDPARSPLFQVMFGVQMAGEAVALDFEGVRAELEEFDDAGAKFDLSLDFYIGPQGVRGRLEYNTDLFEATTAQRLIARYLRVLETLAAEPDSVLANLVLTGEDERAQLMRWSENRPHHAYAEPVHRLIGQQARRTPDVVALVFGDESLSYAQLEARANRLAHRLIALGVVPDMPVGIAVERSVEMVVGLLAILKAGGAYVPIDPEYPHERIAYMLEDSGVKLLLTQSHIVPNIPRGEGVQTIELDRLDLENGPSVDPDVPLHGEHLAYVIYTSGSTGRPKGAANRHRSLYNRLAWMQDAYSLGEADTVLQKTPFSFDVSVWEFFWPLMQGARLVVAQPGDHREPGKLVELIRRHEVTTIHFVPSMLQAFVAHEGIEACTSLKRIVCSGEALPAEAQARVFERLPGAGLYNLYGPTEAAIDVTHWTCQADGRNHVAIGRPISDTKTYVLDAGLNLVPQGVGGELYLGGIGLARGYLAKAALTSERFVADPFSGTGERLYRTGDLVRWREDGQLEYLGRIDHQVKIRGFRIELGEIEAQLLAQPGVREAVVIADEGPGGARLVGYVSLQASQPLEPAELKARLGTALPDYMIPSALVMLDALPLNANGKIDRKALPRPERRLSGSHQVPAEGIEQVLAGIWAEVLGVASVGRHDNFFELGGDSILSLQIVSRLRAAGWKITPRQMFERQTIASIVAFAETVDADEMSVAPVSSIASKTTEASGAVPLLPLQAEFFATDIPCRHHWNQALLFQSRERLDPVALEAALQALVRHHDALRLRFMQDADGQWRQACAPAETSSAGRLLWVRQARDAGAIETLCEEAQRSLDLARGPLLRALAIEVAGGGARLLLAIHHLVVDAVSWRLLLQDLQLAYAQCLEGRLPSFPAKSGSFQDWALALQARAASLDAELPYWQALADAPVTLPCDHPHGANTGATREFVELRLDREHTQALLKDVPAAYRTRVNDVLLTALGRALCDWSGHERVLVDVEGHGREDLFVQLDLSRTVGWFSSLFPVLLDPLGTPGDALRRVKEELRRVPGRGIGHGVLKHMGNDGQRRALAALPRAQVVFNYLGQLDGSLDAQGLWQLAGESPGASTDEAAPLSHAFTVNGQVQDGELRLSVGYSRARHERATVQRWAKRFQQELESLIAHCTGGARGVTPSDFPLAALTQQQLDALPLEAAELDDLYPLSPMQQGMLFHSLLDPAGGSYVNQLRVDIRGLDARRFLHAWQAALDCHEVLRSGFFQGDAPMQWVARRPALPLAQHDWRGLADLPQALDAMADAERAAGFDLATPPLMRLVLVRTHEDTHHFLWTAHHLLLDGWSSSRLMGEVLRRYAGQPDSARAAPARYRDYIAWLSVRDDRLSEAFWREQLAPLDAPTLLADVLPRAADHGQERKPDQEQGQGHRSLSFGTQRVRHLQDAARRGHVTLNTLMQSAWALVLSRVTGQRTVVFGATVAGRPLELPGAEQMLGLFINTLPVVATPLPGCSASEWMRALQARNLDAREHEYTPLYDIQRWAGQGGQALFDSILVFENYPIDEALQQAAPGGLHFERVTQREETHYPLTLTVQQQAEKLMLGFAYARDRFDAACIDMLVSCMEHVVEALAESLSHPLRPLGELDLLGAEQTQRLALRAANDPKWPAPAPVHRLIERRAEAQPEAPALLCGEHVLSYAALNLQANRLAHRLIASGVGPDVRVGIALERGIGMVVALLAVLKAGGTYVPLDPDYPAERLDHMVQDSGMALLLTQSALKSRFAVPGSMALLEIDALDTSREPQHNPDVALHGENLAYVIYTSGSTGRPKGVGIAHHALSAHVRASIGFFGLAPSERMLQFSTLNFDGFVEQTFPPLAAGASLVLRGPDLWDSARLHREIVGQRITVADLTTAYWLLMAQDHSRQRPRDWGVLRQVHAGGEAMPPEGINAWRDAGLGHVKLLNTYGPTEATVTASVLDCAPYVAGELPLPRQMPIGGPLPGRALHVVDASVQLVPDGVAGELCIGGSMLARGYLNRAGLTSERFVADPFGDKGERLYRTGDLVRWREDGQLEYLGRIDHQLKIRGFRIELGEIEALLLAQPGVREAIVVAHDSPGGARLVAHVSPASLDADALRVRLASALPDYMVPSALVVLDALPLNANGKIDRKALPVPQWHSGEAFEAPRGALETQLAAIWAEVLGAQRVGRNDNFFELGGHSLLAMQMVARVQAAMQRQLSVVDAFQAPVLAGLAALLDGRGQQASAGHALSEIDSFIDSLETM